MRKLISKSAPWITGLIILGIFLTSILHLTHSHDETHTSQNETQCVVCSLAAQSKFFLQSKSVGLTTHGALLENPLAEQKTKYRSIILTNASIRAPPVV